MCACSFVSQDIYFYQGGFKVRISYFKHPILLFCVFLINLENMSRKLKYFHLFRCKLNQLKLKCFFFKLLQWLLLLFLQIPLTVWHTVFHWILNQVRTYWQCSEDLHAKHTDSICFKVHVWCYSHKAVPNMSSRPNAVALQPALLLT